MKIFTKEEIAEMLTAAFRRKVLFATHASEIVKENPDFVTSVASLQTGYIVHIEKHTLPRSHMRKFLANDDALNRYLSLKVTEIVQNYKGGPKSERLVSILAHPGVN